MNDRNMSEPPEIDRYGDQHPPDGSPAAGAATEPSDTEGPAPAPAKSKRTAKPAGPRSPKERKPVELPAEQQAPAEPGGARVAGPETGSPAPEQPAAATAEAGGDEQAAALDGAHAEVPARGAASGGPADRATAEAGGGVIHAILPTDLIQPNAYNPNEFTPEQEAQLRAEVQRLGRLPMEIVVRRLKGGRVEVVDGAHRLQVAIDLGMPEVPCQILEANAFEAMLQCFMRGQSGTTNPVKLGRMFREMLTESGLSLRKFAKKIGRTEGTVRNYLYYAEAAEVRNRYAPDRADADVAGLTVEQVREYLLELPEAERDAWLDAGASVPEARARRVTTEQPGSRQNEEESGGRRTPKGQGPKRNTTGSVRAAGNARGGKGDAAQDGSDPHEPPAAGGQGPAKADGPASTVEEIEAAVATAASSLEASALALEGLAPGLGPAKREGLVAVLGRVGSAVGRMRTLLTKEAVTGEAEESP